MSNFTPSQFIPQTKIDDAYDDLHAERDRLRAELGEANNQIHELKGAGEMILADLAAAREALQTLTDAVDPFLADQTGATSPHVGQVQPVSVAECCALNEAFKVALAAISGKEETK